jgi:hypothetical protein
LLTHPVNIREFGKFPFTNKLLARLKTSRKTQVMVSASESEETNFYDNLTSQLRRTSQSLDQTLHLLKSSYQIGTQNAAFVKARHRLFSELKLYGDFIHPSAIDAVTNIKHVEDEKVMVEEANCYLLKVTAIKASLT